MAAPVVAAPEPVAVPEPVAPVSPTPIPAENLSLTPPPETLALNSSPISKPAGSKPVKAEIVVKDAPPPPQVEVVGTTPGADYAWIPGSWRWRERWVWTRGYWALKPRSDAVWAKGYWAKRDDGWVWVRGYWR